MISSFSESGNLRFIFSEIIEKRLLLDGIAVEFSIKLMIDCFTPKK